MLTWVVIFEALYECHDILDIIPLGKSPIKWGQRPDKVIAADWAMKASNHYENLPMQYTVICLIFAQNIDCGYTLEPPRRGGSNVYPQSMF